MSNLVDVTGEQFGLLTVIEFAGTQGKYKRAMWLCRCECGNEKIVSGSHLREGNTISCGCHRDKILKTVNIKHGEGGKTKEYNIWSSMIRRCCNPKNDSYHHYGGRGITVCNRWRNSYEAFIADMGRCPKGMSIDRYPNKDGNYEPSNCRWATIKEQNNNKRTNRIIEFEGESKTLQEWIDLLGLSKNTVYTRLYRNWDELTALGLKKRIK